MTVEVSFNNTALCDATVILYFDSVGSFTLERASLKLGIPLSDLYGAVRRYYHSLPRGAMEFNVVYDTKVCSRCKLLRLKDDFNNDSHRWDGKDNKCKPCRKEMRKAVAA